MSDNNEKKKKKQKKAKKRTRSPLRPVNAAPVTAPTRPVSHDPKDAELYKTAEAAFEVGDRVTWVGADEDIPAGTIGTVKGASLRHIGKVEVAFPTGTWCFAVDKLVRSHG